MKSGIWQKRFRKLTDKDILHFTSSIDADQRLIPYDIIANIAHAEMLYNAGYLSREDLSEIIRGLDTLFGLFENGSFKLKPELEDVHMNIENSLRELIGQTADKIHTARSRNDLIALDIKLYSIDALHKILSLINKVQEELINKCQKEFYYVIPGYTHLQRAQPILWSFYLLCLFFKLDRDFSNFEKLTKKISISPLGAAALSGSSLSIDPDFTAAKLKMVKFYENAMDAVTDRDYMMEIMFYATQIMLHISTFAEDMIVYSSQEFSLIELDDSIATGSSIMPHKKNPDVFELLRAKTAKMIGNLTAALSLLKALPNAYNKDLQELKSIYFTHIDDLMACLNIVSKVLRGIKIKSNNEWAKLLDFSCATDLCDLLIDKGYPFRQAYNLIAECVKNSNNDIDKFVNLCCKKLNLTKKEIINRLKPINSIKSKKSLASSSPKQVKAMLATAKKKLKIKGETKGVSRLSENSL